MQSRIKKIKSLQYLQIDSDAEECESVNEMPIDTVPNGGKKQLPAIKRTNRGMYYFAILFCHKFQRESSRAWK